jgi:hypothetical protein
VTPRAIFVVSGSRALAGVPAAEEWARDILADIIYALPDGSAVVTGGGENGPDAWAIGCAASASFALDRVIYTLDGARYVNGAFANNWAAENDPRIHDRATWPLVRNARMAFDAGIKLRQGHRVAAAGFVAPWSRTRGTAHTIKHLRAAGVYAETFVCPAKFGPRW